MNKQMLRRLIGTPLRLCPTPFRELPDGTRSKLTNETWTLESLDGGEVKLHDGAGNTLAIPDDHIDSFRKPGFLLVRTSIVLKGEQVILHPFTGPIPQEEIPILDLECAIRDLDELPPLLKSEGRANLVGAMAQVTGELGSMSFTSERREIRLGLMVGSGMSEFDVFAHVPSKGNEWLTAVQKRERLRVEGIITSVDVSPYFADAAVYRHKT